MKTPLPHSLHWTLLGVALVGLWAAPASGQTSLLRSSTSLLTYWYPAPSQPLYLDLVGHGLNGRAFNGKLLDGRMVTSVSLQQVLLTNGQRRDLELVDTQFGLVEGNAGGAGKAKAKLSQNKLVAAPGLIFSAQLDDGDAVLLRVEAVTAALSGSTSYLRYIVSYAGDGAWQPLCGVDDSGQPGYAVPLSGRWDYREGVSGGGDFLADKAAFTFACAGHVLAKCVDMGYAPWADGKLCDAQGKHCVAANLAPWHQACTRALRADYCGDGRSWTVDGTMLAVYDGIGVRADLDAWHLEAEWTPAGAACVVRERIPAGVDPPCLAELALPSCGPPGAFSDGTLLVTEVPQ